MIAATSIEVSEGLRTVLCLIDGIEVTGIASSLNSAIQQVQESHPDIVLVDLEMAKGEGYETLYRIRHLDPLMRLIALTSHDYPAARQIAIESGADTIVVKGLDLPDLVAAIRANTIGHR